MRPDRTLVAAAAAAWVLTAAHGLLAGRHLPELTGPQAPEHLGHAGHLEHAGHLGEHAVQHTTAGGGLPMWALMCVAMMTPGLLPAARHVAYCSLRRRGGRSVALFAAGPLAVWVAFGAVVLPLASAAAAAYGRPAVLAAATVACAVWYPSRYRRRAMVACHRTAPLPLVGRAAVVACLRYGLRHGAACAAVCWPLMLAMAALGHGVAAVPAMAVLTLLCLAWKSPARRARTGEFLTPAARAVRALARRVPARVS